MTMGEYPFEDGGAVWVKQGKTKFLSIQLDIDRLNSIKKEKIKDGKINVLAFPNKSTNEKAPQYKVMIPKEDISNPFEDELEPPVVETDNPF